MDVVSYAKAKAVDDRLTQALAAGNNPSGWMADRDAINAKLSDASKISQTLINGTSVINGTLDSPVSVEVQGRTLVSMGSSVLQNGKQFLLADKKTKIRTLGYKSAQTQGVAKFVQSIPTTDTANYVGKLTGSTIEIPHRVYRRGDSSTLLAPDINYSEMPQTEVDKIKTVDGTVGTMSILANGSIAQMIFQFNIIEEIERKIGRIPASTTAGKVAWLQSNVSGFTWNWYGYGVGPAGNKASVAPWRADGSNVYWTGYTTTHSSGTVTKLSQFVSGNADVGKSIDSNGFFNLIAYADASDGVAYSTINTDYIELIITLNSSAQLDNRPILTRIANFEGKVGASTVEVPHVTKFNNGGQTTLLAPSDTSNLTEIGAYSTISKPDATIMTNTKSGNAYIAQYVFSFDVVQEIERNLGRIPKATLADKVQWCKDNIKAFNATWYGYGSGPNGYKAYLAQWRAGQSDWMNTMSHTSGSVSSLYIPDVYPLDKIDSNGFVSFLAYADAAAPVANPTVAPTLSASGSGSPLAAGTYYGKYTWVTANGETMTSPESTITITAGQNIGFTVPALPFGATQCNIYIGTTSNSEYYQGATNTTSYTQSVALKTATSQPAGNTAIVSSTINTDYVELQIELKQQAVLHDPVVPLYQIDDTTEYNNILTTWLEAEVLNRYPKVQGVEHLQNVYAIAEGENMLPPFTDPAWTIDSRSVINNPYETVINANAAYIIDSINLPVVAGQQYTINCTFTSGARVDWIQYDANGAVIGALAVLLWTSNTPVTITTAANAKTLRLEFKNQNQTSGSFTFTNPILTLGSTAKPFTPRNPSYLFATNKLGQIGTVKDYLYKSDGQWYVRKAIEKDIVLDGSISWGSYNGNGTTRRYSLPTNAYPTTLMDTNSIFTKFDGKKLGKLNTSLGVDVADTYYTDAGNPLFLIVSNSDTGFGSSYSPTAQEISAFFYGWQAKTVDANGKPTAWRSLGDGTDAPTQTLAYVSTTKAPNFTPYKLSYVLTTPLVQPTTVEGDIALNGPTQIEVGSGVIVREKAAVQYDSSFSVYRINAKPTPSSWLKYKPGKVLNVYKNGVVDKNWTIRMGDTNYSNGWDMFVTAANYDSTAEYTVSYIVDSVTNTKAAFTNIPLEFKTTYDTSLKSVVDHLVEKQSDLVTITGVNVQAIAELYKRVKALGG